MSSQKDGMIQMTQSYNFGSGTTNNFRGRTIESNNFHVWSKDNMYKSSYAKFHSSVYFVFINRNLYNLRIVLYPVTWDLYQELKHRILTQKVLHQSLNNHSKIKT